MANPIILGVLFSIFVISAFYSVFSARSLVLGIFFSASLNFFLDLICQCHMSFVNNLLYSVFLTTSFFTTLLNLAKSLGTGVNFAMSILSTSVFK